MTRLVNERIHRISVRLLSQVRRTEIKGVPIMPAQSTKLQNCFKDSPFVALVSCRVLQVSR